MQQRLLGQLRCVPICGVMEYQIRCLSFPTELLTSPTGLAALLYGRTSAAGTGSAGTEASSAPPLTSPPGRWRRRHSPQKLNRTSAAGSDGSAPIPHPPKPTSSGEERRGGGGSSSRFFRSEAMLLGAVILILSAVWELFSSHQGVIMEKVWQLFSTTLEVRSSQQPEYRMILDWMGRQPCGRSARNVSLRPSYGPQTEDGKPKSLSEESRETFVPGYGHHMMRTSDGTLIWVHRYEDINKTKGGAGRGGFGMDMPGEHDVVRITFFTRDRAVLHRFLDSVRSSWSTNVRQYIQVYITNYNSWYLLAERARRPLYTLYLPPRIKGVVNEIKRFLEMKEEYRALGIPWRRGYLLVGPPGTGKTSFAMALAGELGVPIHLLPLNAEGMEDESLIRLVSSLPPKCILLVEDLENSLGTNGATELQKVSVGAFLNALDGVASSEGRILLITANDVSGVPHKEAMLRPGRVDKMVQFEPLREEEMEEMRAAYAKALEERHHGWAGPLSEVGSSVTEDPPQQQLGKDEKCSSGLLSGEKKEELGLEAAASPAAYQIALLEKFYKVTGERKE